MRPQKQHRKFFERQLQGRQPYEQQVQQLMTQKTTVEKIAAGSSPATTERTIPQKQHLSQLKGRLQQPQLQTQPHQQRQALFTQ